MIVDSQDARSVTILGVTGSIGRNTVDVLKKSSGHYRVNAVTANTNVEALAKYAIELGAAHAVITDDSLLQDLKKALSGSKVQAHSGSKALVDVASIPVDWVMSSIVGAAGLAPTFSAIQQGNVLALANKECLVCAGDILLQHVKEKNAKLIPVDSEHNAIFQLFNFERSEEISRVILTASGGPFRSLSAEQMKSVTLEQALEHPNWSMGNKITIDSSTMVNKALEVIEAYHLFPIDKEQIEVVVHPESIIHSLVEYIDGAVLAELGNPDMRVPIAYALGWPERIALQHKRFDFTKTQSLNFEAVDVERFPALRVVRDVLEQGLAASIIFNGANEVAVRSFLNKEIHYCDIVPTIERSLEHLHIDKVDTLDDVLQAISYVEDSVNHLVKHGAF